MKTMSRKTRWFWLSLLGATLGAMVYADNPIIDYGTRGSNECVQPGTLAAGYLLTPTNINGVIGQPIQLPNAYGLSMTNGLLRYYVTYSSTPSQDGWVTNGINYTFGNLYYVPELPPIFWLAGTYSYAATINALGNPCSPVTNMLGTVTVNIGTNNADVLLNVDFGGKLYSGETGYAAIGNSARDFWNYYNVTGQVSGTLSSLITADGWTSPVGLLVTNLSIASTNGSADAMYNDYLSASSGTTTLTVTNLPAGVWNIYLYADDGNYSLTAGGNSYGSKTCYDLPVATPLAWQPGKQYVVFNNVVVSNGQPVVVAVNAGQGGNRMVSGLQIASLSHISVANPSGVAWWRAEGNAYDSIGTNNGTLVNGAAFASGEVGSAFSFTNVADPVHTQNVNGSGPEVVVPYNSLWAFETNSFSIELWANFNVVPRSFGHSFGYPFDGMFICDDQGPGTVNKWWFALDDGKIEFAINGPTVNGGAGVFLVQQPFTPATNTWYHFAITRNGSLYTIYTNGVAIGSQTDTTVIPNPNSQLTIGGGEGFYFNGRLDEVSLYNRALSTNEIVAIYNVGLAGDITAVMDSDYDGVSDVQELATRTNPNDPNSVPHIRLGYWPFDDTNTWVGSAGQLPLLATNLAGVPSWSTNAVRIDTNNIAILKYRDVETNGNANINLRNGTVRFWFKPDWSSVDQGGTGPQSDGRLIEMGIKGSTNGWWAMVLGSSGTNLYFGTQTNASGTLTTNLANAISWTSNIWHQVVLTYQTTNSSLYIDGLPIATNGLGVTNYPGLIARTAGFTIGSSASGTNQAKGAFDELETFNYPLDSGSIRSNYAVVASKIVTQPVSQTVVIGTSVTFSVATAGLGSPTYQWYWNSAPIADATNATLVLNNIQATNAGNYSVVVINIGGSVTSSEVVLTVTPGTLVAWGLNNLGQTDIPAGLSNVVAIAAGGFNTTALKSDGTVVAWGNVSVGETDIPAGLSNVVGIAAGEYSTFAIKNNGTVVAWGYNFYGQMDIPAGLSNITAVAVGYNHSVALKSNGTLVTWGDDSYGQTDVPAGLSNVVAIAAGGLFSVALKSDGTVVAWGLMDIPEGLSHVVAVAAGYNHTVALKKDGTVVAWGGDSFGQTDVPTGLTNVTAIASGWNHTVALKNDGTVVAWGDDSYGQTDVPAGLSHVTTIAAGAYDTVVAGVLLPRVATPPSDQWVVVNSNATFSVTATGTAPLSYQWYYNTNTLLAGATNVTLVITNIQTTDAGSYSVVITNNYGSVTSAVATLYLGMRLGYWPFDDTNTWEGAQGQLPLAFTNIVGVPSWNINAALIDDTDPAILAYREVETNGSANICLRNGTIRFWFRSDWTSGAGPGGNGRLIEIGDQDSVNGWWTLAFNADGTQLMFVTQTNDLAMTNLTAAINWASNQWHQVVLTYTPLNSSLYIDGQLATNGAGCVYYPNDAGCAGGFRVGSDANGSSQARGTFEDLETFNCFLDSESAPKPPMSRDSSAYAVNGNTVCPGPPSIFTVVSTPSMSDSYSLSEPGLTNESVTTSGSVSEIPGTYSIYTMNYQICSYFLSSVNNPWYLSPVLSWSSYMVQSSVTIGSGTLTPTVNSPLSFSFVPSQAGNGVVTISVTGTGSVPGNSLVTGHPPANPMTVPFSVFNRQLLLYLACNNDSLSGDGGQLPVVKNYVSLVPSPFGQGINCDSSQNMELKYPAYQNDRVAVTEPDGSIIYSSGTPNIRRNEGTVRFWFKPNWTSGNGLTTGGIFLDMTGAGWTLQVTNKGSTIELDSGNTALFKQTVNWTDSSLWHQIVVTYSQTKTVLYVDGVQIGGNGTPISYATINPLTTFRVGSDGASRQVRGIMDELQTFNYELSGATILADYNADCSLDANGDGIPDLLEFEQGIDPWNPPAQNPITDPAPTPGDTTAPVIQLLEPINAI